MERTLTNAATARKFLAAALAGKPALTEAQIDDLRDHARTTVDGVDVWTASALNEAASLGWAWKSALTADQYDVAGGSGKSLTRSQWHAHCRRMSSAYATGSLSVIGRNRSQDGGIGSIALTTETATAYPPAETTTSTLPPELRGVTING